MTGRNPDKTRVWNFINYFRTYFYEMKAPYLVWLHLCLSLAGQSGFSWDTNTTGDAWVTLPELYKNAGWLALGNGKTYHPGKPPNWDEPFSWSQDQPYGPQWVTGCQGQADRFCPAALGTPLNQFSDYNTSIDIMVRGARAPGCRMRPESSTHSLLSL